MRLEGVSCWRDDLTADAWCRYCAILADAESAALWDFATLRRLVDAYAAWARLWAPDEADELVSFMRQQIARKLSQRALTPSVPLMQC